MRGLAPVMDTAEHLNMFRFLEYFNQQTPGIKQMFHIIDHKQNLFFMKKCRNLHNGFCRAGERQPKRLSNNRYDRLGHTNTSQRDKINAVWKIMFKLPPCFYGQACFADTPRACQCEQTTGRIDKLPGNSLNFVFTPKKWGWWNW
jgi:hypothetical protein